MNQGITSTSSLSQLDVDNDQKELLDEFNMMFQPGKSFPSLALLRSHVVAYGQKYNIVMSTKNSNYRSIHLWCKHGGVYRKGKRRANQQDDKKVIKQRKKATQRTNCECFIKAKVVNGGGGEWIIERSFGEHNHVIPKNKTVYSAHRKQSEEIKNLILRLLDTGQKINNVLEYLHMIGIKNIIKKDIENLQQQYKRKNKKEEQQQQQQQQQQQLNTTMAKEEGLHHHTNGSSQHLIIDHHNNYSTSSVVVTNTGAATTLVYHPYTPFPEIIGTLSEKNSGH